MTSGADIVKTIGKRPMRTRATAISCPQQFTAGTNFKRSSSLPVQWLRATKTPRAIEMAEAKPSPFSFVRDLALGGTSGVIAKTICAPLERTKILLQVSASNPGAPQYAGMMDALVRVPREQGVLALWRGNLSNCMRYFPTQAMNFAFKEKYQKIFVRPREEVGFARWFAGFLAAGGAAGATALTVSYPLEFTYTRLAADTGTAHGAPAAAGQAVRQRQYNGLVDCLAKTVKSDGVRGVYRATARQLRAS